MNPDQLSRIKTAVARELKRADRIMEGDAEYDGADGARVVQELCEYCQTLIAEVEKTS